MTNNEKTARFDLRRYDGVTFYMQDGTECRLRNGEFEKDSGQYRKIAMIAGVPNLPWYGENLPQRLSAAQRTQFPLRIMARAYGQDEIKRDCRILVIGKYNQKGEWWELTTSAVARSSLEVIV